MTEIIGATLLVIGTLLGTLGVSHFVLIREKEKATVVLLEFLLANHKPSKD